MNYREDGPLGDPSRPMFWIKGIGWLLLIPLAAALLLLLLNWTP